MNALTSEWHAIFDARYTVTEAGCWEWTGQRSASGGYGLLRGGARANRASLTAMGVNLTGKLACHHCDNPPCIRPDHLYAGTKSTNLLDAYRRGLWKPGNKPRSRCRVGHDMSDAYVSPRGRRMCRMCINARYLAAKAAA